jgi:MoxR-like ATPase
MLLPRTCVDLALDVLRHRLVVSYEALADNVAPDDLLKRILRRHSRAGGPTA